MHACIRLALHPTACLQIVVGILTSTVHSIDRCNQLQLVFLIIEGALACSVAVAAVAVPLRRLLSQRYRLYETFLAVPAGFTLSLTRRSVNVLEDDDDDSDSDDGQVGLPTHPCMLAIIFHRTRHLILSQVRAARTPLAMAPTLSSSHPVPNSTHLAAPCMHG